MQLGQWLKSSTETLKKAGIGSARLDSLILLEDATGRDRSYLLAHPEYSLTSDQLNSLSVKINQRSQHLPLAYIRGKTEFYGRTFITADTVLVPRIESEKIIEQMFSTQKTLDHPPRIIDIGTGSGCLAITSKLESPNAIIEAVDISEEALDIARQNSDMHQTDIRFFISDLMQEAHGYYDIALANLPYVPDRYQINKAAENEPTIAVFGGAEGLDLYRNLFAQLNDSSRTALFVITESLPFQHDDLASIASDYSYGLLQTDDLVQIFKRSD